MNLYTPTQLDDALRPRRPGMALPPAGRRRRSLHSRLADLAPISFTNPLDGLRRRRLFAIDTWETNNFVWANDNPEQRLPGQQPVPGRPAQLGAAQRQRRPATSTPA